VSKLGKRRYPSDYLSEPINPQEIQYEKPEKRRKMDKSKL